MDYLDGVAFDSTATIKEKYDALNVPFNCRSKIEKEDEINIDYIDSELIISPKNSDEFSDPKATISTVEDENKTPIVEIEIADNEDNLKEEDNWNIYMV